MQLFYAFECKLLEFQQPFYRHAQLSQTDNFWIFNGGWQLHDTETIHSKSFMVQLHLMSVTAYRRQLKHVVQFWKAKRRLRRVDQSFYGKMSANWSHIGCSLHWHINGSQLWTAERKKTHQNTGPPGDNVEKKLLLLKGSSMMKFHTGEIASKREKYGFRRAQRQDTI